MHLNTVSNATENKNSGTIKLYKEGCLFGAGFHSLWRTKCIVLGVVIYPSLSLELHVTTAARNTFYWFWLVHQYWLLMPIYYQAKCKVVLLTYNALKNMGYGFLKEYLVLYRPTNVPRSSFACTTVSWSPSFKPRESFPFWYPPYGPTSFPE